MLCNLLKINTLKNNVKIIVDNLFIIQIKYLYLHITFKKTL